MSWGIPLKEDGFMQRKKEKERKERRKKGKRGREEGCK
jgi:hypothetical protein